MSGTVTTAEHTVHDYKHPAWCNIGRCEPYPGRIPRAGGVHHSTGTAWSVQSDEVDVVVELVLMDDYDRQGVQHAEPMLRLSMSGEISTHVDWSAAAGIEPEDLRMLATFFATYADRCEKERRQSPLNDCSAEDLGWRPESGGSRGSEHRGLGHSQPLRRW